MIEVEAEGKDNTVKKKAKDKTMAKTSSSALCKTAIFVKAEAKGKTEAECSAKPEA
ncbi:hypothetical protein NA644_12030 [Pseudomonas stutzeri]|uniref:hypothetical protein n=1 Tax=Stutzerimonas stutzeri TaxID=316 RepID=UPI0003979A92|nr:hypothetical protein [Stutzerimonas stutzeri]EQM76381.1 hypothetical protein L686_16820 [Stutzerimonas stutzeri MF28]MCI0919052.1 hypothetical protein [Stutzerimonas stutzeri]MCQ4250037.1 hypothetical protein [Stutzerimonas stutzeri]